MCGTDYTNIVGHAKAVAIGQGNSASLYKGTGIHLFHQMDKATLGSDSDDFGAIARTQFLQ